MFPRFKNMIFHTSSQREILWCLTRAPLTLVRWQIQRPWICHLTRVYNPSPSQKIKYLTSIFYNKVFQIYDPNFKLLPIKSCRNCLLTLLKLLRTKHAELLNSHRTNEKWNWDSMLRKAEHCFFTLVKLLC